MWLPTTAGVAAATGLLVAAGGLYLSLVGSTERLAAFSSGADLELAATTAAGIDEEISFELQRLDEVAVAAPAIWHPTHIGNVSVVALGVDARAAQIAGVVGERFGEVAPRFFEDPPALLTGVFLSRELARLTGTSKGDELTFAGGTRLTVLEIVDGLGGLNGGRVMVGLRGVVQRLAGKEGRIDSIFIRLDPGAGPEAADLLAELIPPGAVLVPAGLRAEQAASDLAPLLRQLAVVVAISALVMARIISITAGASARDRAESLGLMRTVGGSTRTLRGALVGEQVILGLPGAVTGGGLGYIAGSALLGSLPGFIEGVVGSTPTFEISNGVLALGIALGAGLAGLSGWTATRRFVPSSPIDKPGDQGSAVRPWPGVAGVVMMTLVPALAIVFAVPLWMATLGLVGGVLVFTWAFAPFVARFLQTCAAAFGAVGRLAGAALARAPIRSWRAASAVMAAVVLVQVTAGLGTDAASAIEAIYRPYGEIDLLLQSTPADRTPSEPLPPFDVEQVPGVASAIPARFTWVTVDGDRVAFGGFAEGSGHPMVAVASGAAAKRLHRHEGAVVTGGFASRRRLAIGDSFTVIGKDGPAAIEVLDIVDIVFGSNKGAVALSIPALARLTGADAPSRYEISLAPGSSAGEVASRIARAAPAGGHVFTGADQAAAARAGAGRAVGIFQGIALVAVGALVVTSFGAAAASVAERRHEIAVLKAVGASRRQLLASGFIEGGVAAGSGIVAGSVVGLVVRELLAARSLELFGFEISNGLLSLWPLVLGALAGLVPVLVGAALPSLRAARRPPMADLGLE